MSDSKNTNHSPRGKNRANHGLKPSDMTPAQRENWERVNRKGRK